MYRERIYTCDLVLYLTRMVDVFQGSRTFPARYAPRAHPPASGKGSGSGMMRPEAPRSILGARIAIATINLLIAGPFRHARRTAIVVIIRQVIAISLRCQDRP